MWRSCRSSQICLFLEKLGTQLRFGNNLNKFSFVFRLARAPRMQFASAPVARLGITPLYFFCISIGFPLWIQRKSKPRASWAKLNWHWGAPERRKIKQNTSDFFLRQSEDLIPPKMKRSDRCDTIFTPQNKREFIFTGNHSISAIVLRAHGIYWVARRSRRGPTISQYQ